MTLAWSHPFSCLIGGSSGSGKTYFLTKFLQNLEFMVDVKIHEIIWCYGISQKFHSELPNILKTPIKFYEGLPELDEIVSLTSPPKILILDDLQDQSSKFVELWSRANHHRNISAFSLCQNIFYQGRGHRDISLNSHYIVLFKNPRESSQIRVFARQVDHQKVKFIEEAYRDSTQVSHGYLLFDFKQSTPEEYRIRTKIFPGEENIIYVPKNSNRV